MSQKSLHFLSTKFIILIQEISFRAVFELVFEEICVFNYLSSTSQFNSRVISSHTLRLSTEHAFRQVLVGNTCFPIDKYTYNLAWKMVL